MRQTEVTRSLELTTAKFQSRGWVAKIFEGFKQAPTASFFAKAAGQYLVTDRKIRAKHYVIVETSSAMAAKEIEGKCLWDIAVSECKRLKAMYLWEIGFYTIHRPNTSLSIVLKNSTVVSEISSVLEKIIEEAKTEDRELVNVLFILATVPSDSQRFQETLKLARSVDPPVYYSLHQLGTDEELRQLVKTLNKDLCSYTTEY